jgi:hypothetical protein
MWRYILFGGLLVSSPAWAFQCDIPDWPKPPKIEDCTAWRSAADQAFQAAANYLASSCYSDGQHDLQECQSAAACSGKMANRSWLSGECQMQVRVIANDLVDQGVETLKESRDESLKRLGDGLGKGKSAYDQLQALKEFADTVKNSGAMTDRQKLDFIRDTAHKVLDNNPSFSGNALSTYLTNLSEEGVKNTALGAMDNLDAALKQVEIDHARYLDEVYLGRSDASGAEQGNPDQPGAGKVDSDRPAPDGNDEELDGALARHEGSSAEPFDQRVQDLSSQFLASQSKVAADRAAKAQRRASEEQKQQAVNTASQPRNNNPSGSWIDREYCAEGAASIRGGIINGSGCDYCDNSGDDPRPGAVHGDCSTEYGLRQAVRVCGPMFGLAHKRRGPGGQCY